MTSPACLSTHSGHRDSPPAWRPPERAFPPTRPTSLRAANCKKRLFFKFKFGTNGCARCLPTWVDKTTTIFRPTDRFNGHKNRPGCQKNSNCTQNWGPEPKIRLPPPQNGRKLRFGDSIRVLWGIGPPLKHITTKKQILPPPGPAPQSSPRPGSPRRGGCHSSSYTRIYSAISSS